MSHEHKGPKNQCPGCAEECAVRVLGAALKVFKAEMGRDPDNADGHSQLEFLLAEAQHILEIYAEELARRKAAKA